MICELNGQKIETKEVIVRAQEHVGFFALEVLSKGFSHMKCWTENDGSACSTCPVKHDGECPIMGIKDAALKEAEAKREEEITRELNGEHQDEAGKL